MSKYDFALGLIRSRWGDANEVEKESLLLELKREGVTIIDVIQALRAAGVFSLGQAKEYISASPAWHAEVESGKILQREARKVLKEFL
ncbi:hypothetical protein HSX11_21855 [Oxalobacteraceae bacterium]|nr:hypothetical protein [Oxalobacteraceae bacterium]